MLERIATTMAEIKVTLLNDEKIRKLVFNDSNAALSLDTPTIEQASKYITLYPIFDFENKSDYSQNSMINIVFADGEVGDDNDSVILVGTLRVNVVVNVDKWELLNNKIRPIELANRIIQLLDNKKFSISNPLQFASLQELIINKQMTGYALLFDIADGSGDIDNY